MRPSSLVARPRVRAALPAVLFALLALPGLPRARADDLPYPLGPSSQPIDELTVELDLPRDLSAGKPASLVVVLHGAGGSATGMAGALRTWPAEGYVVCAPKSKGQIWSPSDLDSVKRIVAQLKKTLPIDPRRVHVVGFSNGGWNLAPLAFDDALRPASATWVAAGCREGNAPKWAKEGLGVLALAGDQDANADAARDTVRVLAGKVRSVEARFQAGLGHAWPEQLTDYLRWWMGVMEGRYTPGDDRNFDWQGDLEAARQALAGQKKGGILLYAFGPEDGEAGRELQGRTFMDLEVRFFGQQLRCVKLSIDAHRAELEALGVKATPAVAVLDVKGVPKKVLSGPIKVRALQAAVRTTAPNKRMPD